MTRDDHHRSTAPHRDEISEEIPEADCWAEFWEVIADIHHRIWLERQN